MKNCKGFSNRFPTPKDQADHLNYSALFSSILMLRECRVSTFLKEQWRLVTPHPPQKFSFQPSKFLAKGRNLQIVFQKLFVTNDSYINLVHRCAEIKNYCIYIALDSGIIHCRQLWAACFERFVGKLYQERTFFFFPD